MAESGGPRPKAASSFESFGDRFRFTIELNPEETTIVSWKKLIREAAANTDSSIPIPIPITPAPIIPGPVPTSKNTTQLNNNNDDDAKDEEAAGPNRLSNVIERIERMYAGNGSSGEDDVVLDDVPDDDEYDTGDSFIDDAELDDYFQVDNSEIKHDGFFVNRGKLERIEPTITISTNDQPKKRRRKDVTKGQGGSDDGRLPVKHLKTDNKGKKASSVDRNLGSQLHKVVVPNLHDEVALFHSSPKSAPGVSVKKKLVDSKVTGQKKSGGPSSKRHDVAIQKSNYISSNLNKSHSGKQLNVANEADQSTQQRGNGRLVERFDLNAPPSRDPMPSPKVPAIQRKDGSVARSKSTMLEKAIKELEKIVAESRPPSAEIQDPDNSSQAVKRRLPSEIKQKLAKVARYAHSSYGIMPMDLIDRLMGIVGHLMQLRTLKKNLKDMANNGLSAKQEKDDRVQKIKQEVAELVNSRIPYLTSKMGPQTANSDDFQEDGPEERALKIRYSMDDTLENKMCDLYDLYVERLEEHSGPPIRRLYEELAALWPSGMMDTDGIKRAIFRAKEKKKLLGNPHKDQETTIKKRKPAKVENTSRAITTQAPDVYEKLHFNSRGHGTVGASRSVTSAFVLGLEKPKLEKAKGNSSSNPVDGMSNDMKQKKKVKRKPIEAQSIPNKVVSEAEERYKVQKHVGISVTKPAFQSGSGYLG